MNMWNCSTSYVYIYTFYTECPINSATTGEKIIPHVNMRCRNLKKFSDFLAFRYINSVSNIVKNIYCFSQKIVFWLTFTVIILNRSYIEKIFQKFCWYTQYLLDKLIYPAIDNHRDLTASSCSISAAVVVTWLHSTAYVTQLMNVTIGSERGDGIKFSRF